VAECLNANGVYMCGIIGTALVNPLMSGKEPIEYMKFLTW